MAGHPFVMGWDAYAHGLKRSHNPHPAGSEDARRWASGYEEHASMDSTDQGRLLRPAARGWLWWLD
jgi:hypothetical protein